MIKSISDNVTDYCESIEQMWSNKNWPQHKYVTRPIYKFFVNKVGTASATVISFLASDLLLHQLPGTALCEVEVKLLRSFDLMPESSEFQCTAWDPYLTLFWVSMAAPVVFAKYKRGAEAHNT